MKYEKSLTRAIENLFNSTIDVDGYIDYKGYAIPDSFESSLQILSHFATQSGVELLKPICHKCCKIKNFELTEDSHAIKMQMNHGLVAFGVERDQNKYDVDKLLFILNVVTEYLAISMIMGIQDDIID